MGRRRPVLLAAIALLAALIFWLSRGGSRASDAAGAKTTTTAAPAPEPGRGAPWLPGFGADGGSSDRAALIAELRSRYGAQLHHPYVQVKMLERLMRYLRARNPEHWREELLSLLREAFPDRYAELAANLQHWLDYEQWMEDQRTRLQGLDDQERRAAIWEARERIFGKEAAQDLWASELKNQAASDALAAAGAMEGATIEDRLERYKEGLEDAYQEQTEPFLERHRQEVLDQFLDLDPVQKDLSNLSPEDRERTLREIRQGLGLSEEALQRWEALDQQRDARWDAGAKYMQEREALAKQYSGDALEAHLRELRARSFGAEAETIGNEEQSGFFRFSHPRKWGRN